jgi:signal peptidase II
MVVYFLKKVRRSTFRIVSLGLIVGGAFGNLVDRVRYGEVIDFVDVGWHQWRWPVFNVADSGVTVGFILLILSLSLASSHHEEDRISPANQAQGTP